MINPYQTLGVAHGASPEECKVAFRALAKTCHPDLHPNDAQAEARFKEINAAYDAITNPQPEPAFQQQQNPFNFHNFHFNFDPGRGQSPFEDLFANLRGGQQRNDITFEVRLTLEDIFHGKDVTVQVPEQQKGAGPRDLKVRIPPGIEDGMRLVIQQSVRQPGGRAGDVHLLIRILPHARFTRQGLNLLTVLPVTAFDILLGNEIEVVDLDNHTIRVAIPSNFDSTRKLRLAGQGMADAQGHRGDLLVDLFVQYPALQEAQRDALRRLAESITSN